MKSENTIKIVEEKRDENIKLPKKEAKRKNNDANEKFREESSFNSSEFSLFVKTKTMKLDRKKVKEELDNKLPVFEDYECFDVE